jgi:hypothetical protein
MLICLSAATSLQAQDEDPWWKKLFKSDDKENTTEEKEDTNEGDAKVLDNYKIGEDDTADASALPRAMEKKKGDIKYHKDPRIDSMDKLMTEKPAQLRGFRVQIFFGNLDQAREARAEYIKLDMKNDCYLEQSPPNFGVRVGDFRTKEEAYEVLVELKKIYPSAYIVPDDIELPKLPE